MTTIFPIRLNWLCLLVALAAFAWAPSGMAQEQGIDQENDTEETADEEKEAVRPTLDLGSFQIKDLRPTRNETARLTFKIHLAVSAELTEKQLARLEHWKHRLRNQVIIAVRTLHTKDFQAADLALLRRIIRIRTNRMLKNNFVEEVLLTEYLFRLY